MLNIYTRTSENPFKIQIIIDYITLLYPIITSARSGGYAIVPSICVSVVCVCMWQCAHNYSKNTAYKIMTFSENVYIGLSKNPINFG
jgi:hypothetical protein